MAIDRTMMKRRAAEAALELVESGMKIGLGTGSTAEQFVNALAGKIRSGEIDGIQCVASSRRIEAYARERGIACSSLAAIGELDLAVDGADEVDPELRLIKGLGGALLREKIVAQASRRFVVIVDDTKLVERLGRGPLPVEVSPFAADRFVMKFEAMGLAPSPRLADAGWLITDDGNRLVDITVPTETDVADLVREICSWAGVIDTGFFPYEATSVIVADEVGTRTLVREEGLGG